VVIEDDVEIGANCAIDRATLGSTILRRGVKFDNLIHIAHNVEVGENTYYAAGGVVAGSAPRSARTACSAGRWASSAT
jgi:UDP-3-O-[3-hydroxymyristoyl] glucosamine N-acyltransferase